VTTLAQIRSRLAQLRQLIPTAQRPRVLNSEEMARETAALLDELEAQGVAVDRDAPEPTPEQIAELVRDANEILAAAGSTQP
jgi:hypothetical protein